MPRTRSRVATAWALYRPIDEQLKYSSVLSRSPSTCKGCSPSARQGSRRKPQDHDPRHDKPGRLPIVRELPEEEDGA
jgi:hypothetical protein